MVIVVVAPLVIAALLLLLIFGVAIEINLVVVVGHVAVEKALAQAGESNRGLGVICELKNACLGPAGVWSSSLLWSRLLEIRERGSRVWSSR